MNEEYILILGNNPDLSIAEIKALYPEIEILNKTNHYLHVKLAGFDSLEAINQLGGTIKIGRVISHEIDQDLMIDEITAHKTESKVNYGLSFYESKPTKIGMEIKKALKAEGISSRLVTSKEKVLSSVIVKKNKVVEFMIFQKVLAVTTAVQDFEEYGKRDYGRPKSDAHSGMLPPKLARIMINLSNAKKDETILDPFCGSGTILTEALSLDYKNLIGSDLSLKACEDTKDNIDWLNNEYHITDAKFQLYNINADQLSSKIKPAAIDAIITEPYLGPTIRDDEKENHIFKIISGVASIYLKAFTEFKNVLKPDAMVIIVMPFWHLSDREFRLGIENKISHLGYKRIDRGNLIYRRREQKVWRQIEIWQNK